MIEKKRIDKEFLQWFLSELETKAHPIYALISGLPKANFYLARYYDNIRKVDCWPDCEENMYSLQEFFEQIDNFHPDDDFGIYFAVHLDRIDSNQAEEYTDHICIDTRDYATIADICEQLSVFLESYCEKCLRDNRPFELTPETIAHYSFTPEDAEWLGARLDCHNAAAKKLIRAEYDALGKLDFIRCNKR